jgi:hypothetical protein
VATTTSVTPSSAPAVAGAARAAIPLLAGSLLVGAGLLKEYYAVGHPLARAGLLDNRWAVLAVALLEVALGVWLASGRRPKLARPVALLCFAVFALVNVYEVATGHTVCGCFGALPTDPRLLLVVDLVAAGALAAWLPVERPRLRGAAGPVLAGIGLCMLPLLANAVWPVHVTTAERGATFQTLEARDWVGGAFPELPYEGGPLPLEFSTGTWVVIFHHPGCEACGQLLARVVREVDERSAAASRIALIEVPTEPHRGHAIRCGNCTSAKLSESVSWLVKTPVAIRISGGTVERSSSRVEEILAWVGEL